MKAKNNPRPTIDDVCEVCGKPYAANHEIFFGSGNRQKSIQHGMQKRLCYYHHNDPSSKENPHFNAEIDRRYKEEYQALFEQWHIERGMKPDEARQLFRREFGENFL